jgi:PhoH-like ATPase
MPLPKPPAKKGDLLRTADYEAQAAPRADKRALKARSAEAPAQAALELLDTAPPATAARVPAAKTPKPAAPAPALASPVAAPAAATGYAPLARTPAAAPRARKPRSTGPAKLFVNDQEYR